MCLELSPGRALGCFLLEKRVSKCCSLSLLPQLCTSPSSVRAKQCVDPTAMSTTFFPKRNRTHQSFYLKKLLSKLSFWSSRIMGKK